MLILGSVVDIFRPISSKLTLGTGEAYKQCFWRVARAFTKGEFEQHMETMKTMLTAGAYSYLMSIPLHTWCRHVFSSKSKSVMLLNNVCESFNNVWRKCRVLLVMEWMRRYMMKRMFSKREGAEKYEGVVMPSALKQLEFDSVESRQCGVVQSGVNTFEVDYKNDRFVVDLEERKCHAFACIRKKRLDPVPVVHHFYSKDDYVKAYTPTIKPVSGPKQWEKTSQTKPNPPLYRKMPGRPSSKKRRKEVGENEERQTVKKAKTHKKMW